jgi:hypothetical protein
MSRMLGMMRATMDASREDALGQDTKEERATDDARLVCISQMSPGSVRPIKKSPSSYY